MRSFASAYNHENGRRVTVNQSLSLKSVFCLLMNMGHEGLLGGQDDPLVPCHMSCLWFLNRHKLLLRLQKFINVRAVA